MPLQAPIQCQTEFYALFKNQKTEKKYENKMLIKYDTKKEENINGIIYGLRHKKQEKCADRLFTGKEAKKLEKMAKGKTGIVELIYYCSH
jgi:hypothetical protein